MYELRINNFWVSSLWYLKRTEFSDHRINTEITLLKNTGLGLKWVPKEAYITGGYPTSASKDAVIRDIIISFRGSSDFFIAVTVHRIPDPTFLKHTCAPSQKQQQVHISAIAGKTRRQWMMTKWSGIDFITKPISLPEGKVSFAEGISGILVPVANTEYQYCVLLV